MTTSRLLPLSYNVSTFGGVTRDYQSISAWETVTDNDLVTATSGEVLDCYADSASYDQSFTMGGAITNSNYFRIIRAADGEGWAGDLTSGFQIILTEGGLLQVVTISEDNSGIYNSIIQHNANSASNSRRAIQLNNNNNKLIGCSVKSLNSGAGQGNGLIGGGAGDTHFIINNLFYESKSTGALIGSSDASYFYNNTVVNNNINGVIADGSSHLKNNIIQDNTTNINGSPGTNITNVTSGVIFQDAANDNYLLDSSDAAAQGQGTDLSADGNYPFDDDILENTRVVPWTVGFHDLSAQVTAEGLLNNIFGNVFTNVFTDIL